MLVSPKKFLSVLTVGIRDAGGRHRIRTIFRRALAGCLISISLFSGAALGQAPSPAPVQVINAVGTAPQATQPAGARPLSAQPSAGAFDFVSQADFLNVWWRWIVLVLLTFVGLGQVLILFFQSLTSQKSAAVAKKTADIAERMVADFEAPFLFPMVLETTLAQDLRSLDNDVSFEDNLRPTVCLTIRNFGRTPALLEKATAVLFFGDLDEGRTDPTHGRVNELMLGPQSSLAMPLDRQMDQPLKREMWDALRSGETKIYLRGRITFLDVLGTRHEQTFCFAWNVEGAAFVPSGPHRNRRKRLSSRRKKLA